MAVDSRHLLDRLEEMAFEEQRAIRAEVDAAFFKPGWSSSPILISASAVAIAAGLRRATARIADEAWAAAEKKDPVFTAAAGQVATHLRIRMVTYYRQRLMSDRGGWSPEVIVKACGDLSETLCHICDKMVDQLARRSRPLPPALLPDLPCLAPAGRGAADPEAPRWEVVGSAPPAPAALVPPATTTAGHLSPPHAGPTAPITAEPVPAAPVTAHPCTGWPRNGGLRSAHHRIAGPGGTCFRSTRHRAVHSHLPRPPAAACPPQRQFSPVPRLSPKRPLPRRPPSQRLSPKRLPCQCLSPQRQFSKHRSLQRLSPKRPLPRRPPSQRLSPKRPPCQCLSPQRQFSKHRSLQRLSPKRPLPRRPPSQRLSPKRLPCQCLSPQRQFSKHPSLQRLFPRRPSARHLLPWYSPPKRPSLSGPLKCPVPPPSPAKEPARLTPAPPPPAPSWSARSRCPLNDRRPIKALISPGCRPCSRRSAIPSGGCGSIARGARPCFVRSLPSKLSCSAKIPIGPCCCGW